VARKLLLAGFGAVGAAAALGVVRAVAPPEPLARTNYRGRSVSLAGGPALALGAATAAAVGARATGTDRAATAVRPVGGSPAAAALVAGLGAGAVGAYDDMVGGRPEHAAKGFRGHLAALREGRVTSGLFKIAGVGASGLAASALLGPPTRTPSLKSGSKRRHEATTSPKLWRTTVDVVLGAGVIAGTANLLNLLDLRPGRAIKAGTLIGLPLALGGGPASGIAAGSVGAAAGLLPADLEEQIMLGDAGANAFGALLGTALAARTGTGGRAVLLAGLAGLTAASEKVSFTQVIQRTPGLRDLDALGRRTD
jgi:UDP-N-acetylmuramyl pentapeptide phosphotransferase/UDP-N-acetylglucosamine-1-phosphate transferase